MTRRYELRRRAEHVADTRRRIVEAAVELHTTLGPARTTISALAERAGVQRHTVYAHFPDTISLYRACSAHWETLHPFPDGSSWGSVEPPNERLRLALIAIYAWYEEVEQDLALFRRDVDALPEFWEQEQRRLEALVAMLVRGRARRRAVRAAIGHALEFETWRSLCRRQGLSRSAAVEAMVRLVASV